MRLRIVTSLLLAALFFMGCSNDELQDQTTNIDKTTYASFNIRVKAPATYATSSDPNGVAVEQTISSLRLFIFSNGILENSGDIIIDPTLNKGVSALKTTIGAKTIYGIANPKDDMLAADGTTLNTFQKKITAALSSDIASPEHFVMIGNVDIELTKKTEQEAIEQPITLRVTRFTAKVGMAYDPENVTINEKIKGTFTEAKFLIAQMNKLSYYHREDYNLTPKASNITVIPGTGTYNHLTEVKTNYGEDEYKNAFTTLNVAFDNSLYTAENVNSRPVSGNTTFALLRFVYTPHIDVIQGVDKTLNAEGDFYVATQFSGANQKMPVLQTFIYANLTEAQQKVGEMNAARPNTAGVQMHQGGLVYYRVNLQDKDQIEKREKYCVLRNHYYQIKVSEIKNIGDPTPVGPGVLPPDPEEEVESDTYVSADIIVEPWNPIIIDEPLY